MLCMPGAVQPLAGPPLSVEARLEGESPLRRLESSLVALRQPQGGLGRGGYAENPLSRGVDG